MRRMTVYERIMRAAERKTGCHLSPEDCYALSMDDAIRQVAENDAADECDSVWHLTPSYNRQTPVCLFAEKAREAE